MEPAPAHIRPQVLKGFRDFLPRSMIVRQFAIDRLRGVFERYGFEPLETPALEYAETLEGKFGEEEKLIYRFADKGGREVALRYDLTVPLARVIAMYGGELVLPFKRYQIGPVWRADKPQKGRYREFWQCDVDIVGSGSPLADAEVVAVVHDGLLALGIEQFTIRINSRKVLIGLAEYAGVPEQQAVHIYRSIDNLQKLGLEQVRREMVDRGIPDAAADRVLGLVGLQGADAELLAEAGRLLAGYPRAAAGVDELLALSAHLDALGVPAARRAIDLSLARGLDYYTGPIFETTVEHPRVGSITGGGRYDELLGLFAGRSLPMVGTSFGLERIIDVLEEMAVGPASATVARVLVTVWPDLVAESLGLAAELRQAGVNTEVYLAGADRLDKQLRYANRKGIPAVAILGPDEVSRREVVLKSMSSGTQRSLPRAEAIDTLARGFPSGEDALV